MNCSAAGIAELKKLLARFLTRQASEPACVAALS
jgi:hypothetical protein